MENMQDKIYLFKKLVNRPEAWDKDVERFLNSCGGDVEHAVEVFNENSRITATGKN